ncbi:lysylphosphatidylglycerol synthase transmembrane domain-containing protein [Hydrogenimonas sp.]
MTNIDTTGVAENTEAKKKVKHFFFLLAKILVSVSLLGFLITKLDFSSLTKLQSDIVGYLLVSTIIMFVALWFMTARWKVVLLLIKLKSYSLTLLYKFYLIGHFFSIFIPGAIGGDAMRFYYISKVYKLTKPSSLLSVFIERIAGLFALAIILMFSLLFNDTLREKLHFGYELIFLSSLGIVLALVIAKYFVNKKVHVGYKDMGSILLLSGLGQFGDIAVAYVYSQYFQLDISLLSLMSIMPLVYIATVIPISLGGVGVREGVMTAGMALYGVHVSDAVIVSFLLYLTKIIVGIFGWIIYLRINTNEESSSHE